MSKIWRSFEKDELLTTEEQKVQEKQQNISVGFWIGFVTFVILFNVIILFI
jgi:hypothetical protein